MCGVSKTWGDYRGEIRNCTTGHPGRDVARSDPHGTNEGQFWAEIWGPRDPKWSAQRLDTKL